MTEDQVRTEIERLIAEAGSLRALARRWKITPSYLSDLRTGRRAPGPQVLGPLGLTRVVTVRYESARLTIGDRVTITVAGLRLAAERKVFASFGVVSDVRYPMRNEQVYVRRDGATSEWWPARAWGRV